MGLPVVGMLLDAGGGTGRIAEAISNLVTIVVVADSLYEMLRQAADKGCIVPLCTYSETLPFPDESFERVIMVDAESIDQQMRGNISPLSVVTTRVLP